MATQADIPEVILHKRLEVEETSLTTGQFEKNLSEYFPVEGKKYESQLNEGLETQECQAESETKQVASSVQVEVTSNVVNGNSGTIEDGSFLTSPSGPTTSDKEASEQEDRQVDELKPTEVEIAETAKHLEKGETLEAAEQTTREDEVMEEKSPKADQVDKNLGQNVEVILNQQDSAEREIEDSEKDERAGEMEDSHAKLSSKEIPSEPEVNLDHKHVQSIVETCPKEENVDNTSSTEATFLKKEFTEEKIFEETKEEDKRVDSVPEGKSSEAICSSDNGGIEDEKNQMQDDAGDASLSTIALSRDESQTHERGESAKDEVERINVANEPVDQEAGVTEKEKHEEMDEAPIETEIPDKESADTLLAAKAEEVCSSQEVDSSEILKVSSKIGSELITREIPVEVTSKTEILEEPTQVRGTASGDVNTIESYEKELDISPRNNEEEIHRTGEGLDITQAAVEEAQHTEEYSHVAAEDISTVKLIQAEEHTEVESKKHEDHADDNLLPSNEPEEKKVQTNFNVAAKEIESETLRGETTTVTPIKEETTNLPLTHSDQKTESTEAELPNNDANNSNASIFLVEQSEVQSEKIGEVSDLGSHEKYQTSDEAPENEKLVEAESDGHQSTEKTIVTSIEGKAPTDVISKESENTKETEKDYGVSSKESFESQGAQKNESEEIKKEAEVIDLDVQKFTSSQESEESSTLDDVPAEVDSTVREIPEEEAPTPIGEDETHKKESVVADFNEEKISEKDVAFSTPESVQEGTSKSFEDNVKDEEKLNKEESPTEIIKEGNTTNLSLEDIQKDATETLKDHEHEAEMSKEEVVEELETVGASECIPSETNKDIEMIFDASLVKQEEGRHEEVKYLDRNENSIEESKVEIAKEEALKLRGEDEGQTQESTEENVEKEQIIERDVTLSTAKSVQEETSKSSQENIKDAENLNEEESTVDIIKEGKLDDLSTKNTLEDLTKTGEDRENEAEKSREEIVKELETARAGESSPWEAKKDVESFVDTSSEKHEEVKYHDQDPIKASIEENKVEISEEEALMSKHEDESHKQEAESNKEQIIGEDATFSAVEAIQEETINLSQDNVKDAEKLNEEESTVESLLENNQEVEIIKSNDQGYEAEKSTEQVIQESDSVEPNESISFKTNKDVEKFVQASPIKQEESQQEGGKYQDIIKASTEENKDETPEEEAPKSKGEDEQIVEQDVTFSVSELIQEETSERSQEEINEEHPAVITKEGNISDLSPENIEEDATEVLKDRENELEESKKEVVEEFETIGPGESIPYETNKDIERSGDASSVKQDEGKQEEVKYLDPIRASVEENTPEIPDEEASKSRGDNKSHGQENAGADFDMEKIIEREVMFSTPESIQEEISKTSQDNVKDVEKLNEEESTVESILENNQEVEIEKSNDHEYEAEKSTEQVVQESDSAGPGESTSFETNKDVEKFVGASPIKQEESQQEDGKYQDAIKALTEENKYETPKEEALKSKGGDEQIFKDVTFSELESIQEKTSERSQEEINEEHPAVIINEGNRSDLSPENIEEDVTEVLKDQENEVEESKKEVVEEFETTGPGKSIPYETNKDVERSEDASSVKQEEGKQEEVRYLDPIRASVEENTPEISDEEASKSRGDDESHREENAEIDFDREKIIEREVTLSMSESIQEETSKTSQDNLQDEESTTEITKENKISNLSQENVQEDIIETLKDHENEVEKSKEEAKEELETDIAGESISHETTKNVESSTVVSSVTKEEARQEEGKYIDPNGASIENKKVEISEEEALKSRGKDESHKQESVAVDFDKEQVVGEEVLSTPEPIQEETSKSSYDDVKDAEKIVEESLLEITKEGSIKDFSPKNTEEDAIELLKYKETDVENSKEVVHELETSGPSKSIPRETNKDVESFTVALSMKQEESQQEEGEYLDQVEALMEEKKFEDKFSTDVVKTDDENKVTTTKGGIELPSKGDEDQQQARQDKPEEKLGDSLHVSPEKTETEKSSEIAKELTNIEAERTIQNLNQTLEIEEEGERSKNADDTNDSEKETPKELKTEGAGESISREINEDAESSGDTLSVKQEERQQEEINVIDQATVLTDESKIEEKFTAEVLKDDEEIKAPDASSKGEEGDECEEKLENFPYEKLEEIVTQTSTENAKSITYMEVEETSHNLEETSETEKIMCLHDTNDSAEIPKELETAGAGDSSSFKISEDAESSIDASSVKQEESHEEEVKYIDHVKSSTEKNKVDVTYSTKVDKEDDDSKVEVIEKKLELETKDGEDKEQAVQKDEPGEKIEDLLHVMPEETEAEPSSKIAREITSIEVEETVQNLNKTSEIENEGEKTKNVDGTSDTEKEIPKELETTGENDSKSSVDTSSLKQEESQDEEVKHIDQAEVSIEEKNFEETSATELAKDEDESKVSDVALKGEEDQQQATQKDEPAEKLENLLPETPVETETETSTENERNITDIDVERATQNLAETAEKEKTKHVDTTNDEKEIEIPQELEMAGTKDEDVERSVVTSSVKQEEDKELDQVEASKEENKVEDSFSTEVVAKEDDDSKVKLAKREIEEDLKLAPQKDELGEKFEYVLQVTPKETETDTSSGNATSTTCVEREGTIQDVEETSEMENKEENEKNTDNENDSQKEIPKEFEAAGAGESSSYKISEEAKSSVDASLVKQEESQQEEVKYIDMLESSTEENKVEDAYSTESDREDDGSKVEVIEKRIEGESKDEEDQQQAVQKDEPQEKYEDLLHVTLEETETGTSREIAREFTRKEVEETVQDLDTISETENEGEKTKEVDGTSISEKEVRKESETSEAGVSIDASSLKQDASQEEEVKYIDQAEAPIEEKKLEETFTTEVVKDDDESKVTHVALEGEEDHRQPTQKDEPGEKLENLLPEMPVQTETETSIENARNITDVDVDGTSQNLEETAELEKTEHVDTTNESEKEIEIPRELETAGTVNEDVERSVVTSLVKQEEENELDQVEASKEENKLEDSFSTELVKEDDDNKLKATEREIEEDLQPAPQKDESGEKLEDVLQVAPEETEIGTSSGNAISVTCVEGEGTIQDVAETSKTENKEKTQKNSDDANVSENEALETTNASQETRDEVSREIGSVKEFSNKCSNTETTEETKEDSVEKISKEVEKKEETGLKEAKTYEEEKIKSSDDVLEEKGVEKGGDSISTEIVSEERVLKEAKPDDEEQIKSFDAASKENGVSSSRDIASESKSVLTGISNEEARLKEAETIVEDQVKSCHIVTEEKGMESNVDVDVQSDFSSTRIKKEETSSNEAEAETVEHVKSYDVAPEEKGLTSNAVIEEKSDSISTEILGADIAPEEKSLASGLDTEIVNEETSLTKAKAGDEERVQSRGFAPENEDLVRDAEVDVQSTFVSAETKSEETVVKEAKTDHEEPIGSSNIAFEVNNLTSSLEVKPDYEEQVKETVPETESLVTYVDTKIQPDSISADIESEGTCLKEDKPENEDKVRSLDIAPQEESSVREEIRLKETESDNKEDVKNSDLVLEEESLVNEEVGLKDVESDNKEEVKNYDIAPEEKGVSRSSIVVGDEQQNEKSEESEENKAPEVIGKFEEKIEQEIKGETPIAEIENKEQDTKVETSLEESSEDNFQDSSVAPTINDVPATTEATEKSDVNHLVIEPTKGEGLLQEEGGSKLESDDAENNITNEEIQKQKDVEITTKDAFPTEVHESIEKAEENESSKEQVTDGEINLKEYQPVSIVDERDYEENDFGPILSEVRDAQLAGTDSEERNLVLQKSESDILQAQKVESVTKLEERSFDLDQVDEKETEKKTIVKESYAVNEAKETKLASETKDVDATWPTPATEKLKTVESKEIMEATEFQGIEAVNEDEITSEQAPDDGTSKGNGHETETTVETEEEIIKEVDLQDKKKTEASFPTHLKREEPGGQKLHEEAENDIETAPETVLESNYESIQSLSKDEVIADQDHHVGVLTEQVEELQTTEDETTEDLALPTVTSKDEVQVSRLEEQDEEKASDSSATKTADEEIKASDSLTNVSGSYETQEETEEASKTVCESDSRSIGVITEDKKITGETFAENQSEVQLLDQSYVLLPKEQEDGITATTKEIEEKTIEETSSQKEVEEITEASETVSKESAPDTEVVSRGIYTDQALPVDKDESITDQALKIPSSSTSVPDEQKHDIAVTVKNVEEEETKVEVTESVGGTTYADSPSEVLETREAFIEASNLNVKKREIASEFIYGKAESPEARTSIEEVEIIENHLKVATTDVRTEEPQFGTTIQAENTTKKEISEKEELRSREILEAKSGLLDVKEVQETIQETKQPEQSSQETSKESLETRITDTPPKLTDPVEETSQTTEPKDTNPRNNIKLVNREITAVEIKEEECEEKETGGTKTESTPVISLSELMQTSKDEKVQVAAEHSIEAEKAKTDEERDEEEQEEDNEHAHEHEHEGHEHEEEDHPDAPILVQSSRDIDSKGGRKKSHGLFSGVGSKVKHSISKVKKAITGKSSHSKTLPQ